MVIYRNKMFMFLCVYHTLHLFSRPLISFRTTPCCELRKVKETSGGPEGDSKSVHTKGKGVGLSEI